MDNNQNKQHDIPYELDLFELGRLYYTRDIQALDVVLIDFSVNHNLLKYVDKHKRIAKEETYKFIPIGKQHNLSPSFANINVLLRTEKEILKDFPDLDPKHTPTYIKNWVQILNFYASCFFMPNLSSDSPEEKEKYIEELKIKLRQNPLFLVETITFNKLPSGLAYRIAADLNPENIEHYFFTRFKDICQTSAEKTKEKLSSVMSEKTIKSFMPPEEEPRRFTLRAIQLFLELFSTQIEEKMQEICHEIFTLFILDMHRDEETELQAKIKEEEFNDLLESKRRSLQFLLNYKPIENSKTSAPTAYGRPKTYTPLSLRQNLIDAAKQLKTAGKNVSLTSICKQLDLQQHVIKDRAEKVGMSEEKLSKFIEQLNSLDFE